MCCNLFVNIKSNITIILLRHLRTLEVNLTKRYNIQVVKSAYKESPVISPLARSPNGRGHVVLSAQNAKFPHFSSLASFYTIFLQNYGQYRLKKIHVRV